MTKFAVCHGRHVRVFVEARLRSIGIGCPAVAPLLVPLSGFKPRGVAGDTASQGSKVTDILRAGFDYSDVDSKR